MASVQALEYPNLVHVVLDNASTDATPDIIRSFEGHRVPLLTARNSVAIGMAANWNAAVTMVPSAAAYFRLLCADDTMRPDAIMQQVTVAERNPQVGLVGSLWRAEGLRGHSSGEQLPKEREVFDGRWVLRGYLRREHFALSSMHVLIRRSELQDNRPFYDASLASFDSEANLRICSHASFGFVHQELSSWRIHDESVTSRIASKAFTHDICWLDLLDRYGPEVLGFRDYMMCRRAYRLHLLRRLLKECAHRRNKEVLMASLRQLRDRGDPAGSLDFAKAIAEWTALAISCRRHLVGLPRKQATCRSDSSTEVPYGF